MTTPNTAAPEYRVLARKYRPQTFADMIGQEALVRTLTNAIQSGRLAHAFMLTGVRGVGKTTSARIVARALNCIGADGTGGPTPEPCGVCDPCIAIAADRHPDVIEMDAASRTGVDDIREIIDGVRYRPISARYKIYIIDEVHMLSKNAFNALLKTLEEPPDHTKFLFATTEIRKVPITVLSRCQRFDLRRIEPEVLAAHFTHIADLEKVVLTPEAAALIGRAADGSARDGMSLLDQAIALSSSGTVEADTVRGMLGLADRLSVYDLFGKVMAGHIAEALALYEDMHRAGADPSQVVQDVLGLCHGVTRLKVAPGALESAAETERRAASALAGSLSVATLTRAWQILLKGAQEVHAAPDPRAALEMVLIRLAYVTDLPSPADLIRRLTSEGAASGSAPSVPQGGGTGPRLAMISGGGAQSVAQAEPVQAHAALPQPRSFEEVVALIEAQKDLSLRTHLMNDVRLVAFEVGKIELMPLERAPRDLAARLSGVLQDWTGRRWMVVLSTAGGQQTLREQEQSEASARRQRLAQHALVQQVAKALGGTLEEMIVTPRQSFLPSAPLAALDPDAEMLDETGDFSVDNGDFLDHTF